jgi:small subunit ribosomal protein S16
MLKIRLQRVGRKHEPTFRLVLTDSKNSTKSGRFDEVLGSYDPRKTIESFNTERIKHWLSRGVGLTGSVNNLLVKKGILRGKKTHVGTDFVAKEVEATLPTSTEGEVETPTENVGAEEASTPEASVEEAPVEEEPAEAPAESAPAPEAEPSPAEEAPAPSEEPKV